MERLLPTDASRLGGNRLLGRLGAGGMGVVYLARTEAGDLAAVKVIQPEYADQAEFRARFRREASSAGQVDSPWVVRVLGADTEAAAPWLATAFVPGPSLEEAVVACGPLPDRAVRVLGKVLARALTAVNEARLVHRDVKPGNVLLALDGPRLIDFGIARPTAADETELTSDAMVVGTPGFLSPEQARARQVGAASDVFSLGCVLVYAATGRPAFGTGAVDALLYRTVHDEPGLDGVADAELRALLGRCLAKGPELRPTAAEVDAALVEDAPAGTVDWLPDPVVRMIAERSAEMLALPGIEPTEVPQEPSGHNRRRVLALGGGAALLLAGGGAVLWAALRDDAPGTPTASSPWVIGLHADLTGPLRETGRAQERGARLAMERFNARRGRPFTLALRTEDDRGEPARAVQAARRLTGAADVLAVLGPTGYSSAQAALEVYDGAGMPLLTVSELSTSAAQSAIAGTAPRSYFRAASLSGYGTLATVTALGAEGAAACARALAAAGFNGPRVTFESVMRPAFPQAAGEAAEGWVFEAPYSEPQSSDSKAAKAFTAAYHDRYGAPPARWAAEAHDAVGLIVASLNANGGGAGITPGRVAERLFKLTYDGVAKPIRFSQDITHGLRPEDTSFLYQVEDGRFRFLGRYDQVS